MANWRKSKSARTYHRGAPVREPYDAVLIVCEGEKTEPNYFSGLRNAYRLSSANIKIVPSDWGTDPMSVVTFAIEQANGGAYDRTYCVFDRDGHANYEAAIRTVRNSELARAGTLFAVPSWPCFEVWVLLHFAYSTAPYVAAGNLSACAVVMREVQRHFQNYTKGHKNVFDVLAPRIIDAIRHAQNLERHNENAGSSNPATQIHKLVQYLINLRPNWQRFA